MGVVHQSLELHKALKERDPAVAEAKMEMARKTAKEALTSTRNLSMELRHQEVRRGLEAALADLLRNIVPPTVRSELIIEGDEALIPPHARNQLFLILREALRNAVAHSGCERVAVELDITSQRVAGCVEDDGRGFKAEEVRLGGGIRSMKERAELLGGTFGVSSEPNGGSKVKVSVPLDGL
jgi:signal transduction histidine kinase